MLTTRKSAYNLSSVQDANTDCKQQNANKNIWFMLKVTNLYK